jgi:hypothetical protein
MKFLSLYYDKTQLSCYLVHPHPREEGISEVGNRAYGYSPATIHVGTYERTAPSLTSSVLGDGGIYSSVNDLRKWDEFRICHGEKGRVN